MSEVCAIPANFGIVFRKNDFLKQILYKAIEIMNFSHHRIITAFCIICFTMLTSVSLNGGSDAPENAIAYQIKTIVIDAGHGGQDYGCSGKNSHEKTVALNIALQLGAMIQEKYPEIKVVYTRKTDVFIELHERAAIANRNNADLFICIHCNANPSSSPFGSETYVMGLHKTEANLGVAKRENDVILMENDYTQHYDGFNPNNPASHIIFSLYQHAYMDQSILFASKVESYLESHAKRSSRGVKQAGFLVLWKTAMPSVLIETGFLTNASEEKVLASENGQNLIAESILKAFADYKIAMEHTSTSTSGSATNNGTQTVDTGSAKNTTTQSTGIVEYQVQFYADAEELKTDHAKFNSLKSEKINYVKENGLYKYRIGPYSTLDQATQKQTVARNAGFKDAFVVAFNQGKRISLEEAKALASGSQF